MADQFVQLQPDSTGKKVDTSELTVGVNTVERQRVVLSDDATAAALAKVQNAAPGASDYGLTVRLAGTATAVGGAASGTALSGNPVLVAGSDGTNARNITVDASGRVTVVGVTGTSALFAQGAAASGATIAGNPVLMGGTFTTTLPTVTTGQAVNFQTTARGEQLVAISSGATAVAVKAASTAAAATDPALVVAVSPNNVLKVGDGTTAAVTTAASTAAATGSAALTVALSPNSPTPATTSANQACSAFIANAVGAATSVKVSAGNVFGFSLINNNAATVFVEFFNSAAPTLGTTTPVAAYVIPASGTLTVSPSDLAHFNCATAISMAAVTAYNGSTTGSVTGTVFYK